MEAVRKLKIIGDGKYTNLLNNNIDKIINLAKSL